MDARMTKLRWSLSAGLAFASGLIGFSHIPVLTASEKDSAITVHVRNYARVAPQTMIEAEKVATAIYRKAGIETQWIDIPVTAENSQLNLASHKTFSLADIQLSIFSDVIYDPDLSNNVMGLAPGTGPDREIVYVYASKVRTLSWRIWNLYINGDLDLHVSIGQILGHVIAHEVGHLLLNQQVHSPHGIMRGEWSFLDFRDMASGRMTFTPEEAGFLRADVRTRNTRRQIIKVAALSSTPLTPEADRNEWPCLRTPSGSPSSRNVGFSGRYDSGHGTYLEMATSNSVKEQYARKSLLVRTP